MATLQAIVAIVEDDPILREALEILLEASGYAVDTYASGKEFLRAAAASKANCVVTDIELGDITGVEMARRLVADNFKAPIIFMTGSTDTTFRQQAKDLGCAAFLNKPFRPDRLIDAIVSATGPALEHERH